MDQDLSAIQETRELVARAFKAGEIVSHYSQEETDRLVGIMAEAGYRASKELAELACEETGFGRVESKIEKNVFATRHIYKFIKDMKTVGVIHRDDVNKVYEIATPMGVVAAIIPVTNPTSTTMFKILIALKARCPIVLSPHPNAVKCVSKAASIMEKAAFSVGAPEGVINCHMHPTLPATHEMMKHPHTAVILATGGSGLVSAAYSSGKPAIGVGPGNGPAFIERTADIPHAVRCLVISKGFDWGTICSSEQAVIVDTPIEKEGMAEFQRQRAYFCNNEERKALESLMPGGKMNPGMVGRSPSTLAKMAKFKVPDDTTILLVRQEGVGPSYPLSGEKLCPILAYYVEDGWEKACERSLELLNYGGMGHTMSIHSRNKEAILAFSLEKPVSRLIINAPTSQGAIGFATDLAPSLTLGCGAIGGNITSDNITPRHLLNIKRLAYVKENWGSKSAPSLAIPPLEESTAKLRNPFDDYPGERRKYYIGPHNKPI